jgi:hypothetical protein
MAIGMPAGLASMVVQASGPLTVLGAVSARTAVHRSRVAALMPVLLTLGAVLGWAIGNICTWLRCALRLASPASDDTGRDVPDRALTIVGAVGRLGVN